jgi:hypothetical protein
MKGVSFENFLKGMDWLKSCKELVSVFYESLKTLYSAVSNTCTTAYLVYRHSLGEQERAGHSGVH